MLTRVVSAVATFGGAALVALAPSLGAPSAAGQSPDPFVAVADANPLALGRVVDRLGDGEVVSRLDLDEPPMVQLAAARAARFMREPELALAPLAVLAAGRDPHVAPVAARAVHAIAVMLDASALVARERSAADLAPALDVLTTLANDETARPDIRRLAALAVDQLRALRGP
jgi:hypothetical protein